MGCASVSAGAPTRGSAALKAADRWLGIPLVLAAAALRRQRALPSQPRRIAVIKTAAIGDTVLLAAAVEALAARHPDATVRLFLGASNRAMAPLIAVQSEVLPIARPWLARARLRAFAADLIIDCEPWARLTPLLAASAWRRDARLRHQRAASPRRLRPLGGAFRALP